MAVQTGRLISVGIGKESSRGTPVSASYWNKHVDLSIDDKVEIVRDDSAFGAIEDAEDAKVVKKFAEGEITSRVYGTSFGLWLGALFGTDTPAAQSAPNGAVYNHVFTLLQSNQHPTLSICTNDGIQDKVYALGMVSELEIIGEVGKYLDFKAKFMSKASASQSNTPSYTAENFFLPQHCTFKHAADISSLSGASAISIKKFSIKMSQNPEADWILGSVAPNDMLNKQFTVSGEIELFWTNDSDFHALMLANTKKAMQLDCVNTDVTLATSSNPRILIQLDRVAFTELSRDLKPDGIVSCRVAFTGLYDRTNTNMVKITLANLVSSAYV